ncbi:MAG: YeiH family protein [Bryobacteraceae bacterium]|nr:putative sulfate exporter family transporter [Solibacteraceae bacterium]MCL4840727.1 putative sulfate exporter family transporter [Bryobacteraceae bacterium]MCO5352847.1 YeiH family protein [Bryobacteraceae bacterium]
MQATKPAWWKHEDWLAVWLAAVILILVLAGFRPDLPVLKWKDSTGLPAVFSMENLKVSVLLGLGLFLLSIPGALMLGARLAGYAAGFVAVFLLALIAQWLAGNSQVSYWGVEYVIFALVLGLLLSNVIGVPGWMVEAVRTEYYIKTGLVLMGATILFGELLQAGVLGMLQAVLVVSLVWYFGYWLARRLRLDEEFSAMLTTAVAICGVSAAIAACGAIQGDKKKLSYVASVVLIVAVPMMVLQPWIVKSFGIPDIVGGAWLGGTLDTSGSVVAAGALISEQAMKIGTIVKFSQNVLIGFAAFLLSLWWTMKKSGENREKPSLGVIWERFPKFVLGFMVASLVFSFLVSPGLVKETKGTISGLRTAWFAMAFVSIGLETKFTDLWSMENGRPLVAFLGAQFVNVIWTLVLAYLIFGGILFETPQF